VLVDVAPSWRVRLALVQEQLGHTHAATTAVYTALSDDFKDRVLYRSLGMDWDDDPAPGSGGNGGELL
jgi:hypothetical protein